MSIHDQNPVLKKLMNKAFAKDLSREECYLQRICFSCHGEAKEFKDEISKKEYEITIWCQNCQDEFFG